MSEPVTLENAVQKANDLRQRILQNDPSVTKEELKEALSALRAGRSAANSSKRASSKSKEPSKPINLQALFTTPVGGANAEAKKD